MPDVRLRINVRVESIVPRMTGTPLFKSEPCLIGSAACRDASGDSRWLPIVESLINHVGKATEQTTEDDVENVESLYRGPN
jgi:hypothetical protein